MEKREEKMEKGKTKEKDGQKRKKVGKRENEGEYRGKGWKRREGIGKGVGKKKGKNWRVERTDMLRTNYWWKISSSLNDPLLPLSPLTTVFHEAPVV
jgi:hypothetical protein